MSLYQRQIADANNELNFEDAAKITGCWNGLAKHLDTTTLLAFRRENTARNEMSRTPSKPTTKTAKPAPKRKRNGRVEPCVLREDSPGYGTAAPRFIDLFCGIGGFRIAFERAGGRCVFSYDYDKFSQQTYEANFGEKPHGDIHGVAVADIPAHDILCGGLSQGH